MTANDQNEDQIRKIQWENGMQLSANVFKYLENYLISLGAFNIRSFLNESSVFGLFEVNGSTFMVGQSSAISIVDNTQIEINPFKGITKHGKLVIQDQCIIIRPSEESHVVGKELGVLVKPGLLYNFYPPENRYIYADPPPLTVMEHNVFLKPVSNGYFLAESYNSYLNDHLLIGKVVKDAAGYKICEYIPPCVRIENTNQLKGRFQDLLLNITNKYQQADRLLSNNASKISVSSHLMTQKSLLDAVHDKLLSEIYFIKHIDEYNPRKTFEFVYSLNYLIFEKLLINKSNYPDGFGNSKKNVISPIDFKEKNIFNVLQEFKNSTYEHTEIKKILDSVNEILFFLREYIENISFESTYSAFE